MPGRIVWDEQCAWGRSRASIGVVADLVSALSRWLLAVRSLSSSCRRVSSLSAMMRVASSTWDTRTKNTPTINLEARAAERKRRHAGIHS